MFVKQFYKGMCGIPRNKGKYLPMVTRFPVKPEISEAELNKDYLTIVPRIGNSSLYNVL